MPEAAGETFEGGQKLQVSDYKITHGDVIHRMVIVINVTRFESCLKRFFLTSHLLLGVDSPLGCEGIQGFTAEVTVRMQGPPSSVAPTRLLLFRSLVRTVTVGQRLSPRHHREPCNAPGLRAEMPAAAPVTASLGPSGSASGPRPHCSLQLRSPLHLTSGVSPASGEQLPHARRPLRPGRLLGAFLC